MLIDEKGGLLRGQSLTGKVAIVTGGGQGIGEAICWQLVGEGANVVVSDVNPQTSKKVASDIGEKGITRSAILGISQRR